MAGDGSRNGLYTSRFLATWNAGEVANYGVFFAAVKRRMPFHQVPSLDSFGVPDAAFDNQQPFTIVG